MDLQIVAKLQSLADLQKIHSRLDKIRQIRGDLPEEVNDLEDELEGLKTRIKRLENDINEYNKEIANRKIIIKQSEELKKKYEQQLMTVKNSREFDALNKEIENAQLDIENSIRKIGKFEELKKDREAKIAQIKEVYQERENDLKLKRGELEVLIAETQVEEEELMRQAELAEQKMDARLLRAYNRIRKSMRNGLAVVTVDRGACGGCFAIIPPQRQYEIRQKKKIIVCENCGRILVDATFFQKAEKVVSEQEYNFTSSQLQHSIPTWEDIE
ncbi:MAG: C4-type zinc ribbon domain-containing protein [Bacteroidia bacterium]|nr:C4-type zinc ribbon domain-containing protein [Bacteroidia bacterium]MDW8158761.1 C4-type zinc ribbon domain-containing protein [Bacteroidia bacterium]